HARLPNRREHSEISSVRDIAGELRREAKDGRNRSAPSGCRQSRSLVQLMFHLHQETHAVKFFLRIFFGFFWQPRFPLDSKGGGLDNPSMERQRNKRQRNKRSPMQDGHSATA